MLVTATGRVPLARRPLTDRALDSLAAYLLPASSSDEVDREDSVRHVRAAGGDIAGEQFTVIAARRGASRSLEIVRSTAARGPEIDEFKEITHLLPARLSSPSADLDLPSADELWPSADTFAPGHRRHA